ncbi:ATP-binding cassette domain-containing protein [Candidatus Enterococcus murrayae]|uniref:ABC transporter ATP-binding protein n=1 Tax=Candidatus Enterococcus murrayae TaxID=2815321 RepID=A0ABS3HPI7_9ENTE|nr:ABC transporter ATP-binding protein [Enterococcus sp. MJM16]MBO0454503.1 ABC transporter ATP-binding protein [Enterococcus sp. MJM16]
MIVKNLAKTIDQLSVLKDIEFTLNDNEIVGLVGRNGSGKTTLFRILAGHYLPDEGDILIDQESVFEHPAVKQEIFFIDEKENFLRTYSIQKIGKFYQLAYSKFDQSLFVELVKKHNFSLIQNYRQLSKGEQALFQIILAICSNAQYLLLDEPFDGLDVIIKKEVIGLLMEHLVEYSRTAMIASHNLAELESLVDRVLLLKNQTIIKDYRLEEMREKAKKLQLVFKTKKVPAIVKENSKMLDFQGRVVTVVFEHFSEELETAIKGFEPLVYEELPLTLEDIFEANLKSSRKGHLK